MAGQRQPPASTYIHRDNPTPSFLELALQRSNPPRPALVHSTSAIMATEKISLYNLAGKISTLEDAPIGELLSAQ